ncbi:dolichyl-phosphate-mannose--protein mannosyltransferase [Leptospira ilyithenensis]|uniref:Dolichyl-phosphate-mannose--protein mannosyltransferase n=1 Tax=Leptospira ilyithenensis TaxID=2484901 RepID=A0A4R9LLL3_9LEPT|nr:dolichyl-phosphate-mannose--protein mannosyltransferase [Leptospira ilyithenensis]TGN07044.1 dolichyl-phosphate-mannose--protein mannosyltransferase [Leptospira ilyithenensis]
MIFFLILPYLVYILSCSLKTSPWFILLSPNILIPVSLVFAGFTIFFYIKKDKLQNPIYKFESKILYPFLPICFALYFLLMLVFPLADLNWGDGILLLETNALETDLFGFQLAMDEIGETTIHSLVSRLLVFFGMESDPRNSYRILSSLSGLIILSLLGWYLPSRMTRTRTTFGSFIFLGAGGFLLFFGYAENYTLVSLIIFLIIFVLRKQIKKNVPYRNILITATILVSLGIYFHLVAGYLAVLLFYLWYELSPKEKKWKDLILCTILGSLILGIGFGYFLFFSDPTIDRQSSHVLHPPFYPLKRLISVNHFKEILFVVWWNASLPFSIFIFSLIFYPDQFKEIFGKKENKLVLVTAFAFLLHGFFHNPQLGFPADWDLMGFYWIPLAWIAWILWKEINSISVYFLPLLVFSLVLQIGNAIILFKTSPEKEIILKQTNQLILEYSKQNRGFIHTLPKTEKKFYAKTDFFLFKAERITNSLCEFPEKNNQSKDLGDLRKEWQTAYAEGKPKDKIWYKDFITRATITNTKYVKSLEANRICHPEL